MNMRTLELLGAGAVALWGMADALMNEPEWQHASAACRRDALPPLEFRSNAEAVPPPVQPLRPMPTRKVSEDLSREAFGFSGLTIRNRSLNSLTSWL